ncbi:hypothetical protein MKZ38_007563 [Zalerion maritima]|uniref:Mediator of RNA polymerase II transcription subunit 17 n=1 Tax=Zalerion maritima TaxID=339359 RepID=A0AAD5RHI8_9PEZI|nr:hypothetical protein MKZ38_007563 [Zalerion maritima]
MSSDAPLALRPWPTEDKGPQSVEEFIARIHADRGGFKNVSQAVLMEEMRREEENQLHTKGEDAGDEMDVCRDEAPENDEEQKKILLESRDEVLRNIDAAQKIAQQTTDFISLLMTKSPQAAPRVQDTLDQGLAKLVGIGTISATRLEERAPDPEKEFDHQSIANGWRAMDYDKTITSLRSASERLKTVIKNESRYWNDMVRVKDHNWALCNFGGTTAMGVRFGFVDAAAQFRKASLAKLPRRLDDGTPRLQTFGTDMNMRLRITIEQDGNVMGRSSLPAATPDDASLEHRILEARNSVFASELWYELNREARTLLAFNIREQGGILIFDPPGADKKILVSVEYLGGSQPMEPPFPDDALAESILRSLQLLLRHYHRQNHTQKFRRKAYHGNPIPALPKAPPPLTNPVYHLLKPLILSARHEHSLQELLSFLSSLVFLLRQIGFKDAHFTLKTPPVIPHMNRNPQKNRKALTDLSYFTTDHGLIAPRSFRLDLHISPEVRLSIRGQGLTGLATTQYAITLLPPVTATSISSAAHSQTKPSAPSTSANPLSYEFPPSPPKEAYPNVKEATYYIQQAVVRVLVMRVSKIANAARASGGNDKQSAWTPSTSGTSLKEASLEREIKVEVPRPHAATKKKSSLSEIGAGGVDEMEIDPKYNVAVVINSRTTADGAVVKRWIWLPDGSGCKQSLDEVVKGATMI